MSAHVPGVIWSLRSPEYGAYVSTYDEDCLRVVSRDIDGKLGLLYISRRDARLLARRLNACLDDTAAKGKYGRRAGTS